MKIGNRSRRKGVGSRQYRQWAVNAMQCITEVAITNLLLTAYCLLLTAYCLLPTAYCPLPTAVNGYKNSFPSVAEYWSDTKGGS